MEGKFDAGDRRSTADHEQGQEFDSYTFKRTKTDSACQ